MNKMLYHEAEDKIFDAYFKDEIRPMDCSFCFCGTLSPNGDWASQQRGIHYPYKEVEYRKMEDALFAPFRSDGVVYSGIMLGYSTVGTKYGRSNFHTIPNYEQKLFLGMTAALDVLKQIHRERGEDVDARPFVKRKLVTI